MISIQPTSPTPPEKKPKKDGLWHRIVNFTANDQDYVAPIKITKKPEPKKHNLWKQIKAALIIITTFYLLLCAFVLLNSDFALFFNNVLGIQYLTIRLVLEYTIYVFFSIFGIFLAIGFLFFGYRAMTIRTKSNTKHVLIWAGAIFFCLTFFANITLFAITYDWFRKIDFDNLDGRVKVYNTSILKYLPSDGDISKALVDTNTKIGPLNVRYDISAYVKKRARLEGLVLTQPYTFEIDYDGDKKSDRGSGENNYIERALSDRENAPIISPEFSYDAIKKYTPKATITGTDVAGKPIKFDLEIPTISIEKIIKIGRNMLPDGGIQYTFDASELTDLGQIRWTVLDTKVDIKKNGYQFSPDRVFTEPTIICMQIFQGEAPASSVCDWKFVTEESSKSNIENTDITQKIDPIDPLKYQFSIEPRAVQGSIKSVKWYVDGDLYVGKFDSGFDRIFDYNFHKSGTYKVEAEVEDTLGNIVRISTAEPIYTAESVDLKEKYTLSIQDENGSELSSDTYDKATQSYLLPDFPVPGILHLDATKIRANSNRLRLSKVEWDANNDGTYETEGLTFDYPIDIPGRYDLRSKYTFTDLSVDGKDIPIIHIDRIAVVGVQKDMDIRVKITPDDNYAPASVHFDASGSKIKKGDIRKFIYDFGDGNTYEGEGVVTNYRYNKPGEYKITVTGVSNTGLRASKTFTLILKKAQETVHIVPSIASGLGEPGLPITFTAEIQGNDNTIRWDFGDGSGNIVGKTPIHTFENSGTYTIKVWVQYASGIEETDSITYIVK